MSLLVEVYSHQQGVETGERNKSGSLITGAGTGISRHVVWSLWESGYSVVLAGRRLEPLEQTMKEAEVPDSRGLVVPTDVSDPGAVAELFAATMDKFGGLDVLFNNAGVGAPAIPLEELSCEQWRLVLVTCVTGAFLCTQHAFRIMKNQTPGGGCIINNGSISAHTPRPHSAPYTAAKHAITGLTKSTVLDGRAFNIHSGQIDIGNAATEMTEQMKRGVLQADGTTAVEPTIDVEYAAQVVVYMASLPLHVNVPFMTIIAIGIPLWGLLELSGLDSTSNAKMQKLMTAPATTRILDATSIPAFNHLPSAQ